MQKAAGVTYLELHGCVGCTYVFLPSDERQHCPLCRKPRLDEKRRPFQVSLPVRCLLCNNVLIFVFVCFLQRVFYFPLKSKLKALLANENYYNMLQHEFVRDRNPHLITDVYDSEAWRDYMGPAEYPCRRIGLQMCVDGIPAFAANTFSLKPLEFMNLSLPPSVRGKACNMLLLMLLPSTLKGAEQKKFYDFAATYELDELFHRGVLGVKAKVFAASMDTKGREELLGMYFSHFNSHQNLT